MESAVRRSPAVAVWMLLGYCSCALALNASLDVSQYAHTAWRAGDGFAEGLIRSVTQAPDGYLWLGTEFGLIRFDGVRAIPWQPPGGASLPSTDIRSLRAGRDGRLWIGTFRGLASWKDGKLTEYPQLKDQVIEALLEDREGTIWVAGWAPSIGRLCRIRDANTVCYGDDGRFGSGVTALYEDNAGNVWAGAMNGLWQWAPGPPRLFPLPDAAERIYALIQSDDGGILIAKHNGLTKLKDGKPVAVPLPLRAGLPFQPHRMLRDRDGGLWIGALVDRGLLHIHEGRADYFARSEGLSSQGITSLLEDREGNIWVATEGGLDRFRDFAIATMSGQQGLSSQGTLSITATKDGSMWIATSEGLNRLHNGRITVYRKNSKTSLRIATTATSMVREVIDSGLPANRAESLFEDERGQIWAGTQNGIAVFQHDRFVRVASVPNGVIHSFADAGAGTVWASHQDSLLRVSRAGVVEHIAWPSLGRTEPATAMLRDQAQGGVWLGFRDGGVSYFKDGHLRDSYAAAEGLGVGMVHDLYADSGGTVWASTDGGLSRIKDGRVLTLTTRDGLPCNWVHWIREDDRGSVWLFLACGLARLERSELDARSLHAEQTIAATVFDSSDGVKSRRYAGYNSVVAKSRDGRLWFLGSHGVSVIDPRHMPTNALPPPVHIEQLTVDGRIYAASNGIRLPPRVRDLWIDYTALSLVAPEKVRFRYVLEGQDRDWKEVINARRVQYSNLPPGSYRFRVVASNNSGVWNETGTSLDFSIAPAYYQTRWFAALVVIGMGMLLFVLHRLRVAQLARQFNTTLDARVNERTRIARDLHDTLLQSFQGALLRFQSVSKVIPATATEANERLERALDQAEAAITEGRNAVAGLRASATTVNDLANGIAAIGAEMTNDSTVVDAPAIDVAIDGVSCDLKPLVRDEAYRIAAEALRNAVKHARARHVTVTIYYEMRQLRIVIRDDGTGIDAETMTRKQTAGHFGLPGMGERAAIVKGQLDVRSVPGVGTEIELRVPAAIAYRKPARAPWWARILG
jgi:signal transduction histidine kinase/ligand-binding sensor domain-containing protein